MWLLHGIARLHPPRKEVRLIRRLPALPERPLLVPVVARAVRDDGIRWQIFTQPADDFRELKLTRTDGGLDIREVI